MNRPICLPTRTPVINPRRYSVIHVYIDDGTKFKYECPADQAREHVYAIVMTGYRSCNIGDLTHYPPHRILKVKAVGQQVTEYTDTKSGT